MLCPTGDECPEGMTCFAGVCRQACVLSTDCPKPQVCASKVCLLPCRSVEDCAQGESCKNGFCLPESVEDGGLDADGDAGDAGDAGADEGDGGDATEIDGGEDAVDGGDEGADLVPCTQPGECLNDSHCVNGQCVPWEDREYDPACVQEVLPGPVRPQLQCVWEKPPDGDPVPDYTHVLHTPLVANLGIPPELETPPRPSVVFISDNSYYEGQPRGCGAAGTLRVIDGATCRELAAATALEDRVNSPVTPAIGDLDLDGLPEVVAAAADGGVIAFGWDPVLWEFRREWRGHNPDGSTDPWGFDRCMWGAVTLADLDDDGRPEVILDGAVWSSDGTRIATVPGWVGFSWGVPAVVADVDEDGRPELVAGEGVWEWNAGAFVLEAGFVDSGARGFTAIADFGDFPGTAGDAPGRPEIVLSGSQKIVVQSLGGTMLRSLAAPSFGGGPPTIADYDGDGVPEVGAAYGDHYVVYDVDEDRVLWQQQSQDHSSAKTGSSVFDFNADGRAEVVYGDECYVRVYDGTSGEVVFSQARFSSTWEENPVVADVDGDSSAEMVMGMSNACQPTYCPLWDPLFAGLRCDVGADCPGGTCDQGLCRCTEDAQCGETYGCTDPLAGTPGTGSVCRARHQDCKPGLRVYRDRGDHWAASRPIWNQHAYAITNVRDDGTVPRTSEVQRNWQQPGLNNFRQNGQGALAGFRRPDLTAGNLQAFCEAPGTTRLSAEVCNRGAALADMGVVVIFRRVGGEELCRLSTAEPVPPGFCRTFGCTAPVEAWGEFEALVDPDTLVTECYEANNGAVGLATCWTP